MNQTHVLPHADAAIMPGAMRQCRTCREDKPLTEFRVGPSGRVKSICDGCTETLIAAYYGTAGLRRCTTCGRLTVDYRCSSCWKKLRDPDVYDGGIDTESLL